MTRERAVEIAGRPTTIVEPADGVAPRLLLVLLHGLQMTPLDLAPFAHSLALPLIALFPRGPVEALDTRGPKGAAWWATDPFAREAALAQGPRDFAAQDPPDLPAARETLDRFADAAAELFPGLPIVLGGFSQGAMLTCSTLLTIGPRAWRERLIGLVLLSGSRVAGADWTEPRLGAFRGLRAYLSHGEQDPDLAFEAGLALRDALAQGGADVAWTPFEGAHEIPLVAWRGLRKFLLGLTGSIAR